MYIIFVKKIDIFCWNTTTVSEEKLIIEQTCFYSSIEYIYMDQRQKKRKEKKARYQTHKGYSKTKKKTRHCARFEKKKKPDSIIQRTDSIFKINSRIFNEYISFSRAG